MKLLSLIALSLMLLFGGVTSTQHQKALQSTFVLYGRSLERKVDHKPLCTAFVYKQAPDGYYLLTEGHCFEGKVPSDITYAVANGNIAEKPELQAIEVLSHIDDGITDIAELHLKTTEKYPVLGLSDIPAQIDDEIFWVGYPEMVSQVLYTGRVGSLPMQTSCQENTDDELDLCKGRFLIQAASAPGASGSPVISEKTGKVVGILEGHIFDGGAVVVPVSIIKNFLQKAHVI